MPQKKGTPTPADAERLRKAGEYKRLAEFELASAVIDSMRHGASIREVAAAAHISERTVIRWRKGQGLPTYDDLVAPVRERNRILDELYGLDRVRELLALLDEQKAKGQES